MKKLTKKQKSSMSKNILDRLSQLEYFDASKIVIGNWDGLRPIDDVESIHVCQMFEPFKVTDSEGTVYGMPGDYLVVCADGSHGIATKAIFESALVYSAVEHKYVFKDFDPKESPNLFGADESKKIEFVGVGKTPTDYSMNDRLLLCVLNSAVNGIDDAIVKLTIERNGLEQQAVILRNKVSKSFGS